jgi:hypothetical protein
VPIDELIKQSMQDFDLDSDQEEEEAAASGTAGEDASGTKGGFKIDVLPERYVVAVAEIVDYLIDMFLHKFRTSKFNEALKPLSLIKSMSNLIKNLSISKVKNVADPLKK